MVSCDIKPGRWYCVYQYTVYPYCSLSAPLIVYFNGYAIVHTCMGDMKPYTTKLPENTAEWFDEYIEDEGISTSAALRQLVEKEKARQELEDDLGDGVVRARIANIDPAVWRCCGDPTFGVDRARAEDVRVVDGRFNEQLPDRWIDINFGQLFACGGPVSTSVNN